MVNFVERQVIVSLFVNEEKKIDLNEEIIKEKFKDDIEDIKKSGLTIEYYIEDQGKLESRNESTPEQFKDILKGYRTSNRSQQQTIRIPSTVYNRCQGFRELVY